MRNGQLHKACSYLDEAVIHADNTMFDTTTQKNSIAIMFGLLKEISPALDSNETDTMISDDTYHPSVFGKMFCKYITVILDINKYRLFEDDIGEDADIPDDNDKLLVLHLKARKQMHDGDFQAAYKTLIEVMDSETVPQRLLLYFACTDMEICCKEIKDFKGAYEYSNNKLETLQKMLSDSLD